MSARHKSIAPLPVAAGIRPALPVPEPPPLLEPGPGGPEERVRFETLPDLPGAELMVVHRSARLWRVLHNTYSVCVVPEADNAQRSQSDWFYRRRNYTAHPGHAMMMEPGEVHVTRKVSGPGTFFVVLMEPSWVVRMAAELELTSPPHLRLAQSPDLQILGAFERFHASLGNGATPMERETRLSECVRILLERAGETAPPPLPEAPHAAVRLARDYLHAHYAEAIRLDDLVAATGMSRFHLVRSFARVYGLPPHAYQTQLRVAAVREALQRGLSPGQIDAGFADQSHMGRHFKRIVGVSPHRYAREACRYRASFYFGEVARTF